VFPFPPPSPAPAAAYRRHPRNKKIDARSGKARVSGADGHSRPAQAHQLQAGPQPAASEAEHPEPPAQVRGRHGFLAGPPGIGKTALCVALAYKAVQQGAEARFLTCTDLINRLTTARVRGHWDVTLAQFLDPHVLVIDEVGYLGYGPDAASVLYSVIDKRYLRGNRPILLTTNKDPKESGQVLHDPDLAAAILDRLMHRGELLPMTGQSYRQHRPGQPPSAEGGR
jgi:DNA replication protein DnaC